MTIDHVRRVGFRRPDSIRESSLGFISILSASSSWLSPNCRR
jgi:hypothetical protein